MVLSEYCETLFFRQTQGFRDFFGGIVGSLGKLAFEFLLVLSGKIRKAVASCDKFSFCSWVTLVSSQVIHGSFDVLHNYSTVLLLFITTDPYSTLNLLYPSDQVNECWNA